MSYKRRLNPNQFTTDEAQTASLIVAEGSGRCWRYRRWKHPVLAIRMCDREALEPASRVFGTRITQTGATRVMCPPHLFPPDGKGIWEVTKSGKEAEQLINRLKPLLTQEFLKKWDALKERCR